MTQLTFRLESHTTEVTYPNGSTLEKELYSCNEVNEMPMLEYRYITNIHGNDKFHSAKFDVPQQLSGGGKKNTSNSKIKTGPKGGKYVIGADGKKRYV